MKEKESGKFKTIIPSCDLSNTMVTGQLMTAKVNDNMLSILPSNTSLHELMWEGANCTTINVENSFITLEDAKYYLSHLPIASPKNVSSSLLPYSADLVDEKEQRLYQTKRLILK